MRTLLVVTIGLLALGRSPSAVESQDIRFSSGELDLAATIYRPGEDEPACAISIIQGSGASGRDNLWARQIAIQMAQRGCAVLLPDKRGVGDSEGDWRSAGFDELAGDALASLDALRRHTGVAPDRTGLLGLSQGGHIAPLAASLTNEIGFVIDAVGSLVPMEEQLYHELENAYRQHGLDDETIAYLQRFAVASFDYLRGEEGAWERYLALHREIGSGELAIAVASWPDEPDDVYWTLWSKIYDYDPLPYWQMLAVDRDVPCLIVLGELDEDDNVPVRASAERARPLSVDPEFTLRIYAETGHALFEQGTHTVRNDILDETYAWIIAAIETRSR